MSLVMMKHRFHSSISGILRPISLPFYFDETRDDYENTYYKKNTQFNTSLTSLKAFFSEKY